MKNYCLSLLFFLATQLTLSQGTRTEQTVIDEWIKPVWNHLSGVKKEMDTTHQDVMIHGLFWRIERSKLTKDYEYDFSRGVVKRRFKSNRYGSTRHRLIYKDNGSFKMRILARNGELSFVKFKTKRNLENIFPDQKEVHKIKYRFVFIDDIVYVTYKIDFIQGEQMERQIQFPVSALNPLF